MRAGTERVAAAILHPLDSVRQAAVRYFEDTDDATVMPIVIEAVERYGRENAFGLLRQADSLPQTTQTVDWLVRELHGDYDVADVVWDNHRFAVALILVKAEPDLLRPRRDEILSAPLFPEKLVSEFVERLELAELDWKSLSDELVALCEKHAFDESLSRRTLRRGEMLVEVLGRWLRHSKQSLVEFQQQRSHPRTPQAADLYRPFMVRLVGAVRSVNLVGWLVSLLEEDWDWLQDECTRALGRIGDDAVVEELAVWIPRADVDICGYGIEALGRIHTDLAAATCGRLLEEEDEPELAISWSLAWLDQFDANAIEPVRSLVLELDDGEDPEIEDVRCALLVTSIVTGGTFDEFEEWLADAESSNWGWRNYRPPRLSKVFFVENDLPDRLLELLHGDGGRRVEPDDFADVEDLAGPFVPEDTFVRTREKIGRNDPCPCGSGKKYKKCCLGRVEGDPEWN